MRNTWISKFRTTQRRPVERLVSDVSEHEWAVAAGGVPEEAASAEHQVLRQLFDTDVLRPVLTLPKEMRETLYLIAVEGMSSREVADVLSIPPSTVLSRMHRIRSRLWQPLGAAARRRRLLAQKRETDAAQSTDQ